MSPHMLLTISHEPTIFCIDPESIYLIMNLGTSHHLWCRVCNHDTFSKVLDVSSEWMLNREELSMFIERRILATLLQPNELQSCLAYGAWELAVHTPHAKYPICQEVMQGVLVPNMHGEVCLCSSIVCPYTMVPSMDQFIKQRLHEHTHVIPWVFRNYQRHEHILSLEGDARWEIEGDNEHGPTSVWGSHHSIRIEPICCKHNTYITSLSSLL
jgi:hypothetical protein